MRAAMEAPAHLVPAKATRGLVGRTGADRTSLVLVLLAVVFSIYAIGTVLWVYVLSKLPLRMAYPVMASTSLLVPAASRLFLSESITPSLWAGAGLAVVGVAVMTTSA